MQKFSEFVQTRALAEAIVDSGCDVDALCDGILGLAQQKTLTEQVLLEAWFGKEVYNELFGIHRGIAKTALGASRLGGVAGQVGKDIGRGIGAVGQAGLAGGLAGVDAVGQGVYDAGAAAGRGLGWLGRKAMGAGRAVGGAAMGAGRSVGRAVGGAAMGAGRAVGGAVSNAASAVGQHYGQAGQGAGRAEAMRQIKDRLDTMSPALQELGCDPAQIQQIILQAIQQSQAA